MNKLIAIIGCILLSIICISCDVYPRDSCDSCNSCNNTIKNDSNKMSIDDDESCGPTGISIHVGLKPGSYGPNIPINNNGKFGKINNNPGKFGKFVLTYDY